MEAELTRRANRSSARNALSYMRDPRKIDGMKKELDAILVKFAVCLHISFTTIYVR